MLYNQLLSTNFTDLQNKNTSDFQVHLENLKTKTMNMITEVNGAIGQSICMDIPDVLVVSSGAAMFHEGNKVNVR